MTIIHLPPVLPGELNLSAINQQLHADEVTLDWSSVEEAPPEAISELLAGLDLVEHSELLGIASVPDQLAESILHVLTMSYSPSEEKHRPGRDQFIASAPGFTQNTDADVTTDTENGRDQSVPTNVNEAAQMYHTPRVPPAQTPRTILQAPSAAALRDELERLVLHDLLGPAGGAEEEVDEGNVRDRYLVGLLAPRDQQMAPEEMDELAIPEEGSMEDGSNDDTALQVASLCPSAIGMSFCVHGDATLLRVTARWGYYKR